MMGRQDGWLRSTKPLSENTIDNEITVNRKLLTRYQDWQED
jgi:hypothetical protein